jgi:hypothetical protein
MSGIRGPALALMPLLVVASACGARRFTLPTGPGTPFPDYRPLYEQATADCRGVRTIRATLSLSGRAGQTRLRGRVDAGLAAPGDVRLEGRAPFGRPVFVLVARNDGGATLVLPRDNRVLRNAPPAAIVEALAGVALDPDEMRQVIAGCGLRDNNLSDGRSYGNNLLAIAAGGTTHFLRRAGDRWRLAASTRGPLTVEYQDFLAGRPRTIKMQTASASAAGTQADLTLKLTDVDINVTLDDDVFRVDVPADAVPLTLDELRRAGPLGEGRL